MVEVQDHRVFWQTNPWHPAKPDDDECTYLEDCRKKLTVALCWFSSSKQKKCKKNRVLTNLVSELTHKLSDHPPDDKQHHNDDCQDCKLHFHVL